MFLRLGIRVSYVWGSVFLRLMAGNSYIWQLAFFRLGVKDC